MGYVLLSFLFGKVKVDEVTGILLSSKDYVFDPDVSMDIFFLMDFVQHSGNSSKLLEWEWSVISLHILVGKLMSALTLYNMVMYNQHLLLFIYQIHSSGDVRYGDVRYGC